MKKDKILHVPRAFLYNLYEHDRKFPFATLFGGRKHRDKFNFFSESEIGCGSKTPLASSPLFAILRELTQINAKKAFKKGKKNRAFI